MIDEFIKQWLMRVMLMLLYYILSGPLLKEAVDDLEWPGGSVTLRLARDPAAVSLTASGTGTLEVGTIC